MMLIMKYGSVHKADPRDRSEKHYCNQYSTPPGVLDV